MKEVTMQWAAENVNEINLIDVRSPSEWNAGHIQGATNIPMVGLLMNSDSFLEKGKTYYIHCAGGVRSVNVINQLADKGYDLVNCTGGYDSL